ncbi:hypothetical protein KORDIASMS9_04035 [Kordia sp. SMS9]|uniref:DUF3857 domain-containing protein n=1 Tax=Kordia sp. SMS9 TaxID=2282170 RepID=UPI000E0DB8E1|nr:DUF3857 domain-containing protein [Kordia sp. SMS9]AXG71777.1 hypothetical protein KORDIASMS9_04035 [Kordia sp. SMS9]
MLQKIVACALVLFTVSISAQNRQQIKIKNIFWGENDAQKGIVDIPEKWQNESAVILYQEYFHDYHKYAKRVRYTSSVRMRVKMLDKAAIEDFSEFSFQKNLRVRRGFWGKEEKKFIGVKIVKPNGEERVIKVDKEAVKTDDEYKLAISGLEVGDVLDYYVYTIEPFIEKNGYAFEPITNFLANEYPTKKFVLKFNTENDFFINFNSYNGAPKLQEIDTKKRNDRRYVLEAENIEKTKFPYWYAPLRELPFFKFQVTFSRSGSFEKNVFNFISKSEKEIKTEVTADEVLSVYENAFENFNSKPTKFHKYFKKKSLTEDELAREAYYYLRHFYFTNYFEGSVLSEAKIIGYFGDESNPDYFFLSNPNRFIAVYCGMLKKNFIPFDIIVAKDRSEGNIKDLLFTSEAETVVRVNLQKPLYVSVYDPYSNLETINPMIENTEAYALTYSYDDKELSSVSTITIPGSKASDNKQVETMNVTFSDTFDQINFSKKSESYGHLKNPLQDEVLFFFDYLDEDYQKYGTEGYINKVRKKKNKARYRKEYNALIDKLKERQLKLMHSKLSSEFDALEIEEDHTLNIINTGRYSAETPFTYEQDFVMKNQLVKKAGKNYLFEVGRLIGGQVSVTQDEVDREQNIHRPFPKSYENNISITIPEGYKVAGLDKLNKNVANETGGFESSATVEGNILKIKTLKYYSNYDEPNSNWNKLRAFLDEAYQFTQEKIMFRKL